MSVIYYKIWRDLWNNKARTIQVVLIIAMGAFAVGMIIGARNLSAEGISTSWRNSLPPMIKMWVRPSIDENELWALKNIEGVAEVEGFLTGSLEWRLDPNDEWSPGDLHARDDYKNQSLSPFGLVSGQWPHKNTFAVAKNSDVYFNVHEGDQVYIRINDEVRVIKIGGVVSNIDSEPPQFGGHIQFLTTRERFGELTGDPNFNLIMATSPIYDEALVVETADRINRHLEKQDRDTGGMGPGGHRTMNPERHFAQDILDGVFLILGILAFGAIILGIFLIYNTITAIMAEQINQIGIMKAIGGKLGQILYAYLLTVLVYGLLALMIAIPLGAISAYVTASFLINLMNMDPIPFTIDPLALAAQIFIALVSPLLASLLPLTAGVRITVREAVTTYGLAGAVGFLDRLVAKMERVPHLVLLTISNTFQNKKRVLLIQLALVSSGIIFMMVMSVRESVIYTITSELQAIHNYQVSLQFEDPERIASISRLTLAQPGVKAVEMWNASDGKIRPANQTEMDEDDENVQLFGMPVPTKMYVPHLLTGRWLQPDDTSAIVLHERLAEKTGLGVGDWITIYHGPKRESNWLVVGVAADPLENNLAYLPQASLSRAISSVNKANTIWIQTDQTDDDSTAQTARNLRALYEHHNIGLMGRSIFRGDTLTEITGEIRLAYNIILVFLATMAVVIGVVGSVGLSGVLSISVLERRREIGVMRAIGASSGHVARLFIGEGLILGVLSWLVALPFSMPVGYIVTQLLSATLGEGDLIYQYAPSGVLYWLAIVIVLSIVASWFPARGAMRISVRESLAYL